MRSRLLTLFVILSVILGSTALLRAEVTITQVTSNTYKDILPHIKDKYVVWQGWGHLPGATSGELDWEIFLYNMTTKEIQQITDNDYDDLAPKTDGSCIVWQGLQEDERDIFLWEGGVIKAISNRGADDVSPKIASGLVVWTSMPFGDASIGREEIMLYDVGSETITTLSQGVDPANSLDDCFPEINDKVVMWTQVDKQEDDDNAKLFVYDRRTESISEDPDYRWSNSPQRDGNLTVLIRRDATDREVFLHIRSSRNYHQITDNSLEDTHACISGNNIAWMAGEEIFLAECEYLFLIAPGNNGVLFKEPPPIFSWEGIGYDRFRVQFSGAPDFPTGETLALLPRVGVELSETSLTLTEEDWGAIRKIEQENGRVYWRVVAKSSDEGVSYSETRSFTIQGEAPVAAAATDTGMDTDTGGGSDCFIGTLAY